MRGLKMNVHFVRQIEFQRAQVTQETPGSRDHGFMLGFRMVDEAVVADPRLLAAGHCTLLVFETRRLLHIVVELRALDDCK